MRSRVLHTSDASLHDCTGRVHERFRLEHEVKHIAVGRSSLTYARTPSRPSRGGLRLIPGRRVIRVRREIYPKKPPTGSPDLSLLQPPPPFLQIPDFPPTIQRDADAVVTCVMRLDRLTVGLLPLQYFDRVPRTVSLPPQTSRERGAIAG